MLINQELLRTFVVTAHAPTFAAAAKKRHVTTSAISQQIKTLEAQLGIALFERVGRNARLTEGGRLLADVLRRHFEAIDDALSELTSAQREIEGDVRIGSPRPFSRIWLRPRLEALFEAHPKLRLHVTFGTPTELERRLAERELDVVLLVRDTELPTLKTSPIYTEHFAAYASPAYLRSHGTPKSMDDLAKHRFIVFDEDLPMHAPWWRASFGPRAALRGEIVCRIESLDEMLALCESGIGIVVLPDYFVQDALRRKAVVKLSPSKPRSVAENRLFVAWRKNMVATARFRAVLEALLT